jgi:hypothetical protein
MKKLVLLLALLLSSLVYSQEITMQGHKYFVDGQQISTREVKEKLAFKRGKSKASTGGLFIGLGVAFMTADLVKGLVSDEEYPTAATYIGAGFLAISVPILIGKNKRMKEGIDRYNSGLKSSGDFDDLELHVVTNQNGYGIQLRF